MSSSGGEIFQPNPYDQIPFDCQGGPECAEEIPTEYTFSSSNPDVGDFVEHEAAASGNPRQVQLGANRLPIPDPHSGLFCAYNEAHTNVSITTGGLTCSEPVPVQGGSVEYPCGTVPLKNPPARAAAVGTAVAVPNLAPTSPPPTNPVVQTVPPPPPPPARPPRTRSCRPCRPPPPRLPRRRRRPLRVLLTRRRPLRSPHSYLHHPLLHWRRCYRSALPLRDRYRRVAPRRSPRGRPRLSASAKTRLRVSSRPTTSAPTTRTGQAGAGHGSWRLWSSPPERGWGSAAASPAAGDGRRSRGHGSSTSVRARRAECRDLSRPRRPVQRHASWVRSETTRRRSTQVRPPVRRCRACCGGGSLRYSTPRCGPERT